jgi:large subunit ribosomal protein L13
MSTYLAKTDQVPRRWFLVNADGAVLGQVALRVANLLRGRGKTIYTPHVDTGDFVIVVNAEKVRLTGKKETQKQYMFYSGWRGGERHVAARDMRKRKPTFMLERAVRGMLPKNTLAREMIKKMHVYAGPKHPHAAQKPETLTLN